MICDGCNLDCNVTTTRSIDLTLYGSRSGERIKTITTTRCVRCAGGDPAPEHDVPLTQRQVKRGGRA